jgi:hypothetical protein
MAELGRMDASVWMPDPVLFIASCCLLFLGFVASSALWGRLVVDLGGPRLPVSESVRVFMVANLGRYVPGKIWQIAGLAALARRRGVPAGTATAAAVLGQGMALVAATLVGLGAVMGAPPDVRRWGVPGAALVVVLALAGLLPPVFRRVSGAWFRLAREEAPSELASFHAVRWLLLYVANWCLYAASFWVLALSLGHSGDPVAVGSAFAAAYVLGYLVLFAPAGVGVREGFLVTFLSPVTGPGFGAVLALVARVWTTLVELVPAAAFWAGEVVGRDATPSRGEGSGD